MVSMEHHCGGSRLRIYVYVQSENREGFNGDTNTTMLSMVSFGFYVCFEPTQKLKLGMFI